MNALNFLDANVWLALLWSRHVHSEKAREWFERSHEEQFLFCRFTQLTVLRLLTTESVMGKDVRSLSQAWDPLGQGLGGSSDRIPAGAGNSRNRAARSYTLDNQIPEGMGRCLSPFFCNYRWLEVGHLRSRDSIPPGRHSDSLRFLSFYCPAVWGRGNFLTDGDSAALAFHHLRREVQDSFCRALRLEAARMDVGNEISVRIGVRPVRPVRHVSGQTLRRG